MLYFKTLWLLRATFENMTSFASRDLHAADLTLGPAKHPISDDQITKVYSQFLTAIVFALI